VNQDFYRQVADLLGRYRAVAVATVVRTRGSVPRHAGSRMIILPDGANLHSVGGGRYEALVIEQALELLRGGDGPVLRTFPFRPEGPDSFGSVCGGEAEVFVEVIARAPRLVIVGGGHCGLALARAASLLDFRILVIEDRQDFAEAGRFEGTRAEQIIFAEQEFQNLPALEPDDYVVLVSRAHHTDLAALKRLLGQAPPRYVGMLGSQRRVETVFRALREAGVSAEALREVHAPVGIEVGAETPEEIAISILAEITRVRRQRV
jgi:xanthine dehydrogenase accessory factor